MNYPFRLGAVVSLGCIAFLLGGCATPYQSKGYTGGFSETQLAADTYEIKFNGNGYSSEERTDDFAMLRASELALANWYPYFVVLHQKSESTAKRIDAYGNIQHNPNSGIRVKLLRVKSTNDGSEFEAAFVANSIRKKYKIIETKQ